MEPSPFAREHEEALAFFVEGPHRLRFRESLASPKRRGTVIGSLDHFRYLDYRWAYDASAMGPREVYDYLRQSGAPKKCYVLSTSPSYDQLDDSGTATELRKALDDLLYDAFGSLISCIPGRLAYYTGEMPDERFILQRPEP